MDMAVEAEYIAMFQAGWFIESMWTQTLVIHMIRTAKIPFLQSHAAAPVTILTMLGCAAVTIIPFTPVGRALGLAAPPVLFFAYLVPCILLYMILVTFLKKIYIYTATESCSEYPLMAVLPAAPPLY